ncbi:MAG: tetratricopeptide repeat protein [Verrucomicrobiota bacterium]
MNRPKKNKVSNPTLPEDQQVDERNLIDLDEAAEVSIEDRIHIYWMENKGFVLGCIVVVCLLIIGINAMGMLKKSSEAKLQAAYTEAIASETLADFAQANSDKELGGFAALRAADTAFGAEAFAEATELYQLAAESIENPLFSGRAKLGHAFALFATGEEAPALAALNAIAADGTLPESIRVEAAYHLAIEADVAGEAEAFESYAAQVRDAVVAGAWRQRLEQYAQGR